MIFSTKERRPLIQSLEIRAELNRYAAAILNDCDSPALIVNCEPDHVHILLNLSRSHSLSDVVMEVKRGTSKWVKTKGTEFGSFQWQNGYGAFSVSQSSVSDVRAYIANQAEHHKKLTFMDEYRAFLERYEIKYDERYVWD